MNQQPQKLDFDNPETVYNFINNKINYIINNINMAHSSLSSSDDSYKEQMDILKKSQREIEKAINEFKSNSEWNKFTISFFGETGAGKSTITETLRILLNEKTKIDQQREFKEIKNNLDLNVDEYEERKNRCVHFDDLMNETKRKIEGIKDDIKIFIEKKTQAEENYTHKMNEDVAEFLIKRESFIKPLELRKLTLESLINTKKENLSWWGKFLCLFKNLKEEDELSVLVGNLEKYNAEKDDFIKNLDVEKKKILEEIELEIKSYTSEKQFEIEKKEKEIINIQKEIDVISNWIKNFDKNINKLKPYADGEIIGDGRSDYTRKSISYDIELNNYPVSIIDVPGIEGDEKKVSTEINKAVQKTHAVFYVTAKDAAPNEGTLERIKNYLGDQTEVWTIYNKHITSPRALRNGISLSDDEKIALGDMEQQLKNALGEEHYGGLITVAGLPAFFSQSTCLFPISNQYLNQKKFLEKFTREELNSLSSFDGFINVLKDNVVGNVEYKIKRNNLNKIKIIVDNNIQNLKSVHNYYCVFENDLIKETNVAVHSTKSEFSLFMSHIKSEKSRIIDSFKKDVRNKVYNYIEKNVGNDECENFFKETVEQYFKIFENSIETMIKSASDDLKSNLEKIQEKLMRDIKSLKNEYRNYSSLHNAKDFNLKFDIDNGINTAGLLATVAGTAMAMWWNPVGWVAIGATVVGLVFSFLKSIWGFFDDDYKMTQQRRNVDENLIKICKKITEEVDKNISTLEEEMLKAQNDIEQKLKALPKRAANLNKDLESAISDFSMMSKELLLK